MMSLLPTPNLQAHVNGSWHDIQPVPGAFIINLGDMLERCGTHCLAVAFLPCSVCFYHVILIRYVYTHALCGSRGWMLKLVGMLPVLPVCQMCYLCVAGVVCTYSFVAGRPLQYHPPKDVSAATCSLQLQLAVKL